MNKSVIKTGRGMILGLDSSSSSSSKSFDDESFNVGTNRRRHSVHSSKRPRGRGRPPKLLKSIKTASSKRIIDRGDEDDDLSPRLPAKRGRPRLRPLGV